MDIGIYLIMNLLYNDHPKLSTKTTPDCPVSA